MNLVAAGRGIHVQNATLNTDGQMTYNAAIHAASEEVRCGTEGDPETITIQMSGTQHCFGKNCLPADGYRVHDATEEECCILWSREPVAAIANNICLDAKPSPKTNTDAYVKSVHTLLEGGGIVLKK